MTYLAALASLAKILAAFFLVIVNGLFVAAEFAFVRVRPTRIAQLAAQGNNRAKNVQECIRHLDAYLSVSQLGITLASLGLGWLGEPAVAGLLRPLLHHWGINSSPLIHSISFVVAFSFITFLHVVFGELAPKSMAIQKAESVALKLARPMKFFYYIFFPGVALLNGTANKILGLFGMQTGKETETTHSEEELRMLISASYRGGQINESEQELLQNVFKFEKRVAEEIMVPRPDVVFLDTELSLEENLDIIMQTGHTRYPLCTGAPDKVLGIIHVKDLFHARKSLKKIEEYQREALYIPEGKRLDNLLEEMQNKHQHMAIVLDEYGGTAGIVSMDNILEVLVGAIQDEFDEEEPPVIITDDNRLLVDGRLDIEEAIEMLGLKLDDEEDQYNTLAGYLMGNLGRCPVPGDSINIGNHKLEVARMKGRRIDRILFIPGPERQ